MKKILAITALCLLGIVPGFAEISHAQASASATITQSFASEEIVPGDTWKVYLKASDPGGKMKYIYATVEQAGGMAYPVSMTRVGFDDRKELSGYIYLYTENAGRSMEYVSLRLSIYLGDGAGNFSQPVVFPLTFSPRAVQASPPAGVFKEKNLGPIMIQLRPVANDGNSASFTGI